MKAVAILREGGAAELADLPLPEPGAGQLRVKLMAAGVNPTDGKAASRAAAADLPFVPGIDGAGEVDKLGEGCTGFVVGDRVFGRLGRQGHGTWAEYVITEASGVVAHIPKAFDFEQAAGIAVAGLTAYGILQELALRDGASVLVIGATGGVGSYLTQLAARAGLVVVATARPELCDRARALGATFTVDHTAILGLEDQIDASGVDELDAIVDLVGDKELLRSLGRRVRTEGKIVSTAGGVDEGLSVAKSVNAFNYHRQATRAMLEELAEMVRAEEVAVPLDRVVGLSEGAAVLEESRSGHLHGKTVLALTL